MLHKIADKMHLHHHHKEEDQNEPKRGPAVVVEKELRDSSGSLHIGTESKKETVVPTQHTSGSTQHVATTPQHAVATPVVATQSVVAGVAQHETVVKPAIVEETIRKDTLVEIQPIIHKDVEQNVVHHIEEHVVEPAAPNLGGTHTNAPIIDEHVHTKIVEVIQPIIHREVAVPRVERVEEHISEHIVAPTIHTHEVKETIVQPTTTQHIAAGGVPVQKHL